MLLGAESPSMCRLARIWSGADTSGLVTMG
eukprot:COSAG02_NODE_2732_length_8141_cov_41.736011_8_plen_30_part_00